MIGPDQHASRRQIMNTAATIGAGLAISLIDDFAAVGIGAAWAGTPMPADEQIPQGN